MRRGLLPAVTTVALAGALLCQAPAVRVVPAIYAATEAKAAALVDLRDPADLRAAFNKDRGRIRLVLLVSPT